MPERDASTRGSPSARWLRVTLAIGAVAWIVAIVCFAWAQRTHAPTAKECSWMESLERIGVTPAQALEIAAARPVAEHDLPHVAQVHHMVILRYAHAVEDGQAAHASRWQRRGAAAAAVGTLGLLLAFFAWRATWPGRRSGAGVSA